MSSEVEEAHETQAHPYTSGRIWPKAVFMAELEYTKGHISDMETKPRTYLHTNLRNPEC